NFQGFLLIIAAKPGQYPAAHSPMADWHQSEHSLLVRPLYAPDKHLVPAQRNQSLHFQNDPVRHAGAPSVSQARHRYPESASDPAADLPEPAALIALWSSHSIHALPPGKHKWHR